MYVYLEMVIYLYNHIQFWVVIFYKTESVVEHNTVVYRASLPTWHGYLYENKKSFIVSLPLHFWKKGKSTFT